MKLFCKFGSPQRRATIIVTMFVLLALSSAQLFAEPTSAAYKGLDPVVFARIRADFYKAAKSIDATMQAIGVMDANFKGSPESWPAIIRAYRAMLEGLMGKHEKNLVEKLNRVNSAIKSFGNLVETYPDSIEMRFLRYAFFSQLPGIFNVGQYVKPDLEALMTMYERGGDGNVPRLQLLDMAEWLRTEGQLEKSAQDRLSAAVARLR